MLFMEEGWIRFRTPDRALAELVVEVSYAAVANWFHSWAGQDAVVSISLPHLPQLRRALEDVMLQKIEEPSKTLIQEDLISLLTDMSAVP